MEDKKELAPNSLKDLLKEVLGLLDEALSKLNAVVGNSKVAIITKLLHGVILAIELIL